MRDNRHFKWGEYVTIHNRMVSGVGDFERGIHPSKTTLMTNTLLCSVNELNKKYVIFMDHGQMQVRGTS
jgi:hypothetical protein